MALSEVGAGPSYREMSFPASVQGFSVVPPGERWSLVWVVGDRDTFPKVSRWLRIAVTVPLAHDPGMHVFALLLKDPLPTSF